MTVETQLRDIAATTALLARQLGLNQKAQSLIEDVFGTDCHLCGLRSRNSHRTDTNVHAECWRRTHGEQTQASRHSMGVRVRAPRTRRSGRGSGLLSGGVPMTTCLLVDPDRDTYCGQPAHHYAGLLPVCDDCREWLLHNEWPYEMREMEEAS